MVQNHILQIIIVKTDMNMNIHLKNYIIKNSLHFVVHGIQIHMCKYENAEQKIQEPKNLT